ncbi:MAG TPA: hypothetical protein VMH28_15280 [Candidatus Acidoferrales bacterium]|nr:hypothetical protein [Candidatus Acidoferrales bacterium]
MKITRRDAIGIMAAAASFEPQLAAQQSGAVSLNWLGGAEPGRDIGVSWGVPWARGAVRRDQTFALTAPDGRSLPLQQWPLAYWPDGSIKFSGFAAVAGGSGPFRLAPGTPAPGVLKASSAGIDTGRLQCVVGRASIIDSMTIDGRVVARDARLVCALDGGAEFVSDIRNVALEQSGPVRATVKLEGVHKNPSREWLPFVVRLYFYSGQETVRVVHTIVFDGDHEKDFIRGLGLVFAVPMREQVHNRHVRLSGEGDGLWSEPVQPITGRRFLQGASYPDQLAGKRIANKETFNAAGQKLLSDWAVWDDFKLVQANADGFTIQKRTNPQSCWLDVIGGRRSDGLVFAGDVSGGLAVGVKNFWQSHPASLEVGKAATDAAELRIWLWSPDAPAMDLRHYDTRAHDLDSSYEDVQPGFSTPHGVARTSEMTLFPAASVPTKSETLRQARLAQMPPLLVAPPEHLVSAKVFGIWGLPDRSTDQKKQIEDQIDACFEHYRREVDQRHWYGFWNFGDVMHQHDGPRHEWRYDIGGFAWDNTELGTDMWFWHYFLRTGRADAFRMAEAMTRHTSEVDTYHLGRFAMLGSRHNVRHWGCGAKEARISQAAYRRYYHYLTTDERTGDIMREVVNVDATSLDLDPMRLAQPRTGQIAYPARVRGGPDWLAYVGNWMTEWERTGDTRWRDKIVAGMDSVAAMPFGFLTGPNQLYGYDPKSGKLYALEQRVGTYNLATIMGGAEVVFELNELIDHAGWKKAWEQYCRLHNAPQSVVERDKTTGAEGADGQYSRPGRLSGYLYRLTKNEAYARRAWAGVRVPRIAAQHLEGPEVVSPIEDAPISTNSVSQGCLEAIEVIAMCG